ncbi:hypothetical protein ECANGB1_874 [Enterospora canceri]|uniref:GOLD domain-containing protein n=1 Tax=Enterospora canceri TaxID=1081671 RepID=A0A1Y1S7C8_9MICR|nr:hypothetical protein ECANGB1_874 [Enterospora canceri]
MVEEVHTYVQEVTTEDEQFLVQITPPANIKGLRVTVKKPSSRAKKENEGDSDDTDESSYFDEMGEKVEQTPYKKKFTAPGEYVIMVTNASKKTIYYSMSCYVSKKERETDAGIDQLRDVLHTLSTHMDNLRSENYYYNTQQNKNIEEAKTIRRMVNLLILFPVLTILVGWAKHAIIRGMVKPSKKKFSKVF